MKKCFLMAEISLDKIICRLYIVDNMEKFLSLPSFENHETLPEKISSSLEGAILQGKIKPGDRLIEDELSAIFKVSRAPIREAFRLLEKGGLIRRFPRRGAVVESISPQDISDIFEIRSVLEGLAARLFCQRAEEKEIQHLERIYESMKGESNTLRYRKLNGEFHEVWVEGCRNKKVKEIYQRFQKQTAWFQKITLSFIGRPEISLKEHKKILEAIRDRDAEKAEREVRQHIEHAACMYLKTAPKNTPDRTVRE